MAPASPKEAREAGVKRYNTGKPCINGHMSDRNMKSQCIKCLHEKAPKRPGFKAMVARRSITNRNNNRNIVINHYGGKCACCSEKEMVFLCIDHINGREDKHKRGRMSSKGLYRELKNNNFPDGYQVLCWNCNAAKSILGECPHKREEAKKCE